MGILTVAARITQQYLLGNQTVGARETNKCGKEVKCWKTTSIRRVGYGAISRKTTYMFPLGTDGSNDQKNFRNMQDQLSFAC